MTQIRPFTCYYAHPEKASEIACPAYDAMTPAQRHEFAVANPDNYLNVMRSTHEFPEDERPTFDLNLQRNSAKLQELLAKGTYLKNEDEGFYIYRLEVEGHVQTGLIAELPVEEFIEGGVKKHEHTRRDKEDELILYRDKMRVSSTPVTTSFEDTPEIAAVIDRVVQTEPLMQLFCMRDGLKQTLWFVKQQADIDALQNAFASLDAIYLTDGHHRSAVCERWAQKNREENPGYSGDEPFNFVLTAMFPDSENRILEYNRYVSDLNGHTNAQFLALLSECFDIELLDINSTGTMASTELMPQNKNDFSMYLSGQWHRLRCNPNLVSKEDPVHSLDVQYLQTHILDAILGISDPREDARLDYFAGALGLNELESRVTEGGGVAFACYPTSIDELKAIADAGEVMPPKSTWFDPKVRSGLLVRLR